MGWAAVLTAKKKHRAQRESYQNENFEIQIVEEDGKFLVYTRRTVKEWAALRSSGTLGRGGKWQPEHCQFKAIPHCWPTFGGMENSIPQVAISAEVARSRAIWSGIL